MHLVICYQCTKRKSGIFKIRSRTDVNKTYEICHSNNK